MDVKEVSINNLLPGEVDIKEKSYFNQNSIKDSLQKYGQIYPIIAYKVSDIAYVIIKGTQVLEAMKELEFKTVWIREIPVQDEFDVFKFISMVQNTTSNIDVLKYGLYLSKLSQKYSVNEIAERTGMKMQRVINYIDLIKLDNLIKKQNETNQLNMF